MIKESLLRQPLLALTLYLLWSILFIFCVLAPEGMNAIVFEERRGKGAEGCGLFLENDTPYIFDKE